MRLENKANPAQMDADQLYIGNLNTVEFDLILPSRGPNGSVITWKSDSPDFLSSEGTVTQPLYGMGDRNVTLYACARHGKEVAERSFTVHILESKRQLRIVRARPAEITAEAGMPFRLPSVAVVETEKGGLLVLPVAWKGGPVRIFPACGEYSAEGAIADPPLSVTARMHLRDPVSGRRPESIVEAFGSGDARLDPGGAFWEAQSRNLGFLLTVNDDQMLYNFRRAAGLDTRGAPQMIGWDAPDCQLRGHTTGHYLSALALCHEATDNERIAQKAAYMVDSLRECQERFSLLPGFHEGFVSGYSEDQFDRLEQGALYPEIWAPYYTLHKILAGLLDCHRAFHSATALHAASELGMWVYRRLSRLPREHLLRMWGTYIAGEFGGMNDSLAQLYQLTGEKKFLAAARLFDNDRLFYPMEQGADTLDGMHANQHIPQAIGALRLFGVTGETRYYQIAVNFWNFVTRSHIYAIGGTGEGEMFHPPDEIARRLSDRTAESCASYNMLKLTAELFRYSPKVPLMDYYERTMLNHILSSGEQRPTGGSTYFMPLAPGFRKLYDTENSCCHGTGLENHFRYATNAYYKTENSLWINLFLNSHVHWREKNLTLTQRVFHSGVGMRTLLTVSGRGPFSILIRRPYWCAGDPEVQVNGDAVAPTEADGYLEIRRPWRNGDTVECRFPCALRLEPAPDDGEKVAVCWGPYVLAAVSDSRGFLRLGEDGCPPEQLLFERGGEDGLEFVLKSSGVRFVPLYRIQEEAYQVYLSR